MLVSVWSVAKLAKPISKRRKRWAQRTRTGCTTCRSRRIKCDEARPECLRCISSNRTCGGYSTAALTLNPSTQVCPLGREPPHEEVLMFGLLRDEALSRLTGSVVTQLWSHDVLQATQSYPAVWHAGLAMAAMHKRKKIQGDSEYAVQSRNNYYSFSLTNYNASIKHLMEIIGQKQLSDRDRETVLIASVLFLSLCSLQDHAKEAILHAQSGANLYYQWEMCDPKVEAGRNGILSLESLTILMATLECAHIAPIGQYTMAKKWYWKLRPLPDSSSVPFNSLSEAYADFIPLLNLIIDQGRSADSKRLFSTAKHDNPSVWNRYQQEFRVWRDKFRDFQLSWTPNDDELGVVLELEMFSKLFDLIFGETAQAIEMHWDSCTQEFEEIVDIGEQMWQLQTKTAKKYDEQEGTFTLSLSPGEVLYFVVASCRDGDVRRRAISLMKKWKRRNGVWDTTTIAALCETLVMYEEGAASDDDWCECVSGKFICHGHRTAWIKGGFREDGEMVMRMKSVHDVKNDKPGVKYVLHF